MNSMLNRWLLHLRVNDCCLTPTFQLYHGDNMLMCNVMIMISSFLLDKYTLSQIFIALDYRIDTRKHFPNSASISLCSFFLMLRAYLRSNKYQLHSPWFDPIGLEPTIYHTLTITLPILCVTFAISITCHMQLAINIIIVFSSVDLISKR